MPTFSAGQALRDAVNELRASAVAQHPPPVPAAPLLIVGCFPIAYRPTIVETAPTVTGGLRPRNAAGFRACVGTSTPDLRDVQAEGRSLDTRDGGSEASTR